MADCYYCLCQNMLWLQSSDKALSERYLSVWGAEVTQKRFKNQGGLFSEACTKYSLTFISTLFSPSCLLHGNYKGNILGWQIYWLPCLWQKGSKLPDLFVWVPVYFLCTYLGSRKQFRVYIFNCTLLKAAQQTSPAHTDFIPSHLHLLFLQK